MSTLLEQLGTEPSRAHVITDCVTLIDTHVKTKGLFVRSAYVTIKALKRGIVAEVVSSLLDDWLRSLEPHHVAAAGNFPAYLVGHADEVAEALLSVTDARAAKTSRATARKLYARLRDSAKTNVREALPDLARLIERHLPAAAQTAIA